MAKLQPELNEFFSETDRLLHLMSSTAEIDGVHRKVIAEIVHLRLSILLENNLKRIFSKICCGALYLDGSVPNLIVSHRSMVQAEAAMKTLNRARNHRPKWNDSPNIRQSLEHLIHPNDHCITSVRNFGSHLTDMRFIRNHIAHRNDGTRDNYKKLIRRYYGASVPGISCGTLLLSPRVSVPPLIEIGRAHV